MTECISHLLKLKIGIKSGCKALFMGLNSYFFSSIWFFGIIFCPTPATDIGNVEVFINLPVKAVVQRGVMVYLDLVTVLTAL